MSYGAHAAPQDPGATAAANAPRWDGTTRGRYEVWYLTLQHRASGAGFWLRYTLEAPQLGRGEPYAQLWLAAFRPSGAPGAPATFALNRRFPVSDLTLSAAPFAVRIGEATLDQGHARGALEGDGHRVAWDLTWLPAARPLVPLPDRLYGSRLASTLFLLPHPDVPVRGTIELDGETLDFDGDAGGQAHVWGKKHAHAWAWAHASDFQGIRGAVFEAVTARLRRGPLVLPPLTGAVLRLDGEDLRFVGLPSLARARGRFRTGAYELETRAGDARLRASFRAPPDDMVLAEYHDPDGERAWCANSCIASTEIVLERRGRLGRWREDRRLVARGTACFEVGGRTPDAGIGRRHLRI